MYPGDTKIIELYITGSFISFCEPVSLGDEFLLTQIAFCIFEGLLTGAFDCYDTWLGHMIIHLGQKDHYIRDQRT
jgi:hypothetical protein